MRDIPIEKNIPIPPVVYRGKAYWKELFVKMKVGDSVVLSRREINSAKSCAIKMGVRLTLRRFNDCGDYRVWKMRSRE